MTDKEKLDKLVAEIKRRITFFNEQSVRKTTTDDNSCALALQGVLCFYDSLQKEPVSEDKITISKEWFEHCKKSWYNEGYIDGEYNRDRQFEEPVSEDLGEFINELSKQFPEVSFAKVCKIATRTAKWQKQQMMKDAIEGNVLANGMGDPILHLWDKGKHLVGKKVKVIIIKED